MTDTSAPAAGRSLKQAVATALILVAAIFGAAFLGKPAFFVLICLVVLIALFELLDGMRQQGGRPVTAFGLACGFAALVVAYIQKPAWFGVVLIVTMYGGFLLALRPDRGPRATTDAAWTLLGVAWVTGGGAAATAIMMLDDGLALLIAFVAVAALDDVGAFFTGTRLGRHKMAPSISPAKSWEGFAGGFVSALAAGVVVALIVDPLEIWQGLALGALCGVLVPAGDLVESLAKRELGLKDSGALLPGHGGLLDRLDAIIFSAPAAFLFMNFVVVG